MEKTLLIHDIIVFQSRGGRLWHQREQPRGHIVSCCLRVAPWKSEGDRGKEEGGACGERVLS